MKKNLLIVSNSFPNQDNTYVGNIFVKEQIKYLKQYFDNVYVVSPIPYGMEHFRSVKYCDYQFDNVKVFFPKYINNPLFWYYQRDLWVDLEAGAIISLIKKEHLHFDLIHAHFTWPSGTVAVNLKQKYSVPVVITEHTSDTFINAIKTQDKVFINTWNKADKIIRVNPSDVALFDRVHIPLRKVIYIPNGYDSIIFHHIDRQKCREVLHLPLDKKVILNIGILYDEIKGHNYLIEAMSQIVTKRKDILCVIIGAGKLRTSLEGQIRSLRLEDSIILAGGKPHDEIPVWINACDLFVLPSLNESGPTVMFECLGCGKPFVGTKVGSVQEVITSDMYGLLVEPADSKDLAEKILLALHRQWDQEKILAYAERFTWENISKEIMTVYKEMVC
ncbi:MAG: glycosyltransferase family 4 protein [Deltaproteobacteria bacterium]|nr:glycosyltransferase family 4 protein [Deltaproteobacteria bacterium]